MLISVRFILITSHKQRLQGAVVWAFVIDVAMVAVPHTLAGVTDKQTSAYTHWQYDL